MTEKDRSIYTKAVRRLSRMGIKDPTAQIIALEKEIDHYREQIKRHKDGYKPTLHLVDEIHDNEHFKADATEFLCYLSAKPGTKTVVRTPDGVYLQDPDKQGWRFFETKGEFGFTCDAHNISTADRIRAGFGLPKLNDKEADK